MRILALLMLLWTVGVIAAESELPLRVQSALNARNVPHETLSV